MKKLFAVIMAILLLSVAATTTYFSWLPKSVEPTAESIEVTGELDKHTRNVLRAFQMHFRPSQVSSEPTAETTAILFALIEKYYPEQLEDLLRVDAAEEDMTQPQVAPAGLPTDAA